MSQFHDGSKQPNSSMSVVVPSPGNNPQNLSSSQLRELQGVLKNPISGRQVMIPLTSKAFVIGSLQPEKDANGEEKLLLRDGILPVGGGCDLKEMQRKEIYNVLEKEKQKKKNLKKQKMIAGNLKGKGVAEKSNSNTPKAKNDDGGKKVTLEEAKKPPETTASKPSLPFFDIKEEIDGSGKIVRSEAVNVTKQLEMVAKQAKEAQEEFKDAMETQQPDDGDYDDDDEDPTKYVVVEENDNKKPLLPVTEQEYQALSARLDELAKLEEEAEANAADNLKSAKKLQGKSWSKGFLSGSPRPAVYPLKQESKRQAKTKVKDGGTPADSSLKQPAIQKVKQQVKQTTIAPAIQPVKQPVKHKQPAKQPAASGQEAKQSITKPKERNQGWSKGFLNSSTQSKALSKNQKSNTAQSNPTVPASENDEKPRKVSFQPNIAEVREIPRSNNDSNHRDNSAATAAATSSPSSITRPFDSSVFSGVVKERPIGKSVVSASQTSSSAHESKPKKKLSKFAQERMQNK